MGKIYDPARNGAGCYDEGLRAIRVERDAMRAQISDLTAALQALVECVEFDANGRQKGIVRVPGNGGLISADTMQAATDARRVLSRGEGWK